MGFYSRRHYRSVSPASDTKAQITERVREASAWSRAEADRLNAYPVITPANFDDAIAYRLARVEFYRKETV